VVELRIAISPCPNDIFTFGAWILAKVPCLNWNAKFEFHDIQKLNDLGRSAHPPHLLKFSFAHYLHLEDRYEMAPVGSALGRGVGPLWVSRGDKIPNPKDPIWVPGRSTTAVTLFKHFYPQYKNLKELSYDKIMPQCIQNENSSGLIIHESRFTYQNFSLIKHADLGEIWEDKEKLPLPLGGIAVLKSLDRKDKENLFSLLSSSLTYAFEHGEELFALMQSHAQEMDRKAIFEHVHLYVNDYSKDLGAEGWDAVHRLLDISKKVVEL